MSVSRRNTVRHRASEEVAILRRWILAQLEVLRQDQALVGEETLPAHPVDGPHEIHALPCFSIVTASESKLSSTGMRIA